MTKILFVCHGNICRSPLAEILFRDLAKKRGVGDMFYVYSSGTSDEEHGNPIYPPVKSLLRRKGIIFAPHNANRMSAADGDEYDMLIGMDNYNLSNMRRIVGPRSAHKCSLLLDYTDTPGAIDDPWYTDNFELAYEQILKGCEGLLDHLLSKKK